MLDPPRQPHSIRPRDAAGLLLVTGLWALCYPLITAGIGFAPPLSFAALRALIAGTTLALLAALLRRPAPRALGTWAGIATTGLSATSLGFLGMSP